MSSPRAGFRPTASTSRRARPWTRRAGCWLRMSPSTPTPMSMHRTAPLWRWPVGSCSCATWVVPHSPTSRTRQAACRCGFALIAPAVPTRWWRCSTSVTSSGSRDRSRARDGVNRACSSTRSPCSSRRCTRHRRSSTVSRTRRRGTASATSTCSAMPRSAGTSRPGRASFAPCAQPLTSEAFSKSRRPSCSRSPAAVMRCPSRRTGTHCTPTCTCASPSSCTSSV